MPSLGDPPFVERREVLRLIAAGAAASLAGCSKPDQPIVPAVEDKDGDRAGRTRRYATTLTLAGYGRGATALVVDGRPIKLEGSARHPASVGATDLFVETAILDLYDPQRLRAPVGPDGIGGWSMLERALVSRLAGSNGEGTVLLTGRVTSPTLLARIAEARQRMPGLRHVRAEAIDDDAEREGTRLAFGRPLTMRPRLAEADVLVLLDADPLGPGPDQIAFARAWADRRGARGKPQRTYVVEPSLTQSGVCADRRAALHPALIGNALLAIAGSLGAGTSGPVELPPEAARVVAAMIRDVRGAQGRAIVMAGRGQPPQVHALAAWINHRLAAPVDWIEPVDPDPSGHVESLADLSRDMAAGRVSTLLVLDANPLLYAPPALGFGDALKRVPLSVSFAAFADETAMATRWRAPLVHALESWGDARGPDGTVGLIQPMVKPLFGGRSGLAAIAMIDAAGPRLDDHDRVRRQWQATDDTHWRDLLVAGVVEGMAAKPVEAGDAKLVMPRPSSAPPPMVVTLPPSATLWDGRGATNAWAQECPDPITRQVWGAALRISPADARRLGVADQDVVAFAGLTAPVKIVEGQADGVATLPLGHGRTAGGPIATAPGTLGPGTDGYRLRGAHGGWVSRPVTLVPTGDRVHTPRNQRDFELDGEAASLYPVLQPGEAVRKAPPQASLLGEGPPPLADAPQWAMVIDTSACIGCNACVIACQAENNVPAIGPEQIGKGRDMHWLRVDRYEHDAGGGYQPVPCMQCEKAPCEPVCPVEAPVHSADGLNLQVYNRCIGTRTCQANCPYKVRRFNFLDYAGADLWGDLDPAPVSAQRNPDVTVRARGVMEKCTYCVQRIEAAKHEADATGAPLGTPVTACQSACPTQAIRFGNLADAGSDVVEQRRDPRHYALLEELGTRPRTTYLAKVRNAGDEA
ncbi:4Fe-4S dicluster domain-containing protein [Sphingomonas sp. CGMCC 1.13654]|uniref:4Fe-4S dicluster domain-containing protein n=1 Tax=Sphingomonas chungangi TaxID=2683589 RepID=A0A838L4H1_9SPHN|nr:4Fe-4S binding protein [Sphingomonas chungangi]MBA2934403.1 4Fe-4S dicluster domain-containing protein [Sphingomonas chungangi]MVW57442.1 4Fe-4S dicluster domain-containing protein [Sphingomonas chungangi]